MKALSLIWSLPALRLAAGLMLLVGAMTAGFGPYTPLLAVRVFGLTDGALAAVLAASSVISVGASVLLGLWADRIGKRRSLSLFASAATCAGLGLMTAWPAPGTFLVAHLLILPMGWTLFGQLFTLARLAAQHLPPEDRDAVTGAIRALFALPFLAILPLWSLALARGLPLLALYPVGLVLALAGLILILAFWPRDGATIWTDAPSGLSLPAALAEMAAPRVALGLLGLGVVGAMASLYVATIGLVMTGAGRPTGDAGLFFGLVAGLEVPFILLVPRLQRRASRAALVLWGAVVFAAFMVLLPLLAPSPLVWGLTVLAALGNGILLALPLSWLQDLLAHRPGAGAALMSVQNLIGNGFSAAVFALGTALSGYGLALVIGAGLGLLAALALWRGEAGNAG